jgi:hypothetical protein
MRTRPALTRVPHTDLALLALAAILADIATNTRHTGAASSPEEGIREPKAIPSRRRTRTAQEFADEVGVSPLSHYVVDCREEMRQP